MWLVNHAMLNAMHFNVEMLELQCWSVGTSMSRWWNFNVLDCCVYKTMTISAIQLLYRTQPKFGQILYFYIQYKGLDVSCILSWVLRSILVKSTIDAKVSNTNKYFRDSFIFISEDLWPQGASDSHRYQLAPKLYSRFLDHSSELNFATGGTQWELFQNMDGLFDAVQKNSVGMVLACLQRRCDVNCRDIVRFELDHYPFYFTTWDAKN